MKSRDYWKRRMAQIAARQQHSDETLEQRLRQGYETLRRGVDEDLAKFYARYAAGEGITMAVARKRLSKAELEGFRITLEEFRAKAIAGGYDRELNEIYLRSRVSRLQALQTQIDLRTRALFQDQRDLLHGHLAEGFSETYYRTIYELGKEFRIPASAAHLDAETVEQVLPQPWLGEHFSGRVWSNRDLLLRELGVTLSQGLVRGDSLERMSRLLAKRMQVSRSRAETLVETESAHFAAEATLRGYRETGVDRYDFLASLDERTCEVCGPLDLKCFRTVEQETGVNYPPMHPRCRCTTIPHFDDDFGEPGTRAARDSEGKTIQVPADMTYEQWRKQISGQGFSNNRSHATIGGRDDKREAVAVHEIGKIDVGLYQCVTPDIVTDEVIITDERIEHVKQRHPDDYERFCSYLPEIIRSPDYIMRDERPNTAIVLKEIVDSDTGRHFRLSLRLVASTDNPTYKNSILTFLKVRKREYDRLVRNKEILYRRE